MKKIESGRSMIEMLGVLAIIGVLSIGGLAGYTMAMNRYRANSIADYAMRCATVAQTNGLGYRVTTGDCNGNNLLNEDAPSFSTGCTVAASTETGAQELDCTVACTGIQEPVLDVLVAKFEGQNVGGVEFTKGTVASGKGPATFTFKPATGTAATS